MIDKERLRRWLESYDHEQLIGLLLYEYTLEDLHNEMLGDIKAGEYKEED